ncbi:hypothetical protein BGZ80_009854 [Entomortierella chlamydospora]|uniref:Uncharacterized protein n=1 Tax=Entomortierella chlamydospora TaxID=101097 RepID=A0A9P6T065_9FUNG|nr:hypothetical protein BGZ79_005339 [Entomortierella chlamydospora]KAG0015435.1 hypothetical protein BGZ80_009854 [Entomortierella chlamydospora]
MEGDRPQRTAKEKASISIKDSLPPPEHSDLTSSDSDGDTYKPQINEPSSGKGKERRRESLSDGKPQINEPSSGKGKERRRGSPPDSEDGADPNNDQAHSRTIEEKTEIKSPTKQTNREKNDGALKDRKKSETSQKRKRASHRYDDYHDSGDDDDDSDDSNISASDDDIAPTVKRKNTGPPAKIKTTQYFKGNYWPNFTQAPLMSLVHSLMTQEQKAARALAFMVLDGGVDDETYRWPVRENLLPAVPKSSFMDESADADFFEQQGMGFVEELTGVPKTEADYSDEESGDESDEEVGSDEGVNSANEADEERELHERRLAKKRRKLRQERHANERMANSRLEQVNSFLREEIVAFARKQYRKGISHRVKDLHSLQKETLPPFRIQAARSSIGGSKRGDEEEDELTPIQENTAAFAAEDSLRRILDRLPYVIRQGALGEAPDYVKLGLPKPVSSVAEYERGWDTLMAAASISGVDDRILKKVGLRMKNLLSQSKHSRYYEAPPKAMFATAESNENMENLELPKIKVPCVFKQPPPPKELWKTSPAPLYLSREFIDPLDPKYNVESTMKNIRERRRWLVEPSPYRPKKKHRV